MKKFLLSLFIVPLLFIGSYSSADTVSVSCPAGGDEICTPFPAVSFSEIKDNFCLKQDSVDGTTENVNTFGYCTESGESSHCYYSFMNEDNEYCFTDLKELYIFSVGYGDITYNFSYQGETQETVGGNILELGASNFTPVIDGISDVTTEFIPYVVYIGIGTLLVTLGFIAVKWLVNWLVRKITVIFKSKRS